MDTKGLQSRTEEKQKTMGHALGEGQCTTKEKWVTLWGRGSAQRKRNGSRFGAGAVNNEREMGHALEQGVHNEREMGHALGKGQGGAQRKRNGSRSGA